MISTTLSRLGADLDPKVREFISVTNAAYASFGSPETQSIEKAREVAEAVRAPWVQGGPVMVRTEEMTIETPHGPVRCRLYDPTPAKSKPCLVYVHGGGWVIFSIDTHDRLMREYAARSGLCVLGVDYDRSPEVRFPVALEEIVAVVRYARENAAELCIDGARLLIGGDSAGANMSLSAALILRDSGEGNTLKGLLLNYGAYDCELTLDDSQRYGGEGYMLTADEMNGFWTHYLRSPQDRRNILAAPLQADLSGLPPVFLCIPQCDVLTSQSLRLNERLKEVGVPVTSVIYAGASHSFLEAVSIAPVAERAFYDAALWLKDTANA